MITAGLYTCINQITLIFSPCCLSSGNLGQHVTNWKKKLRLYMSDNGGVTWRELFTGYKRFQLLNFGVFTAVVDKTVNTFYTQ